MDIQEITYRLLAEKNLTYFDSQKYVDWAVVLLENGFDSESLIILAGLDSYPTEEKEKYFWESIRELNIKIEKNDSELIEHYANFIVNQVIEDRVNPMVGLSKMLDVVRATDYSSKYIQFELLDEDIDYLNYSQTTIFNTGLTLDNKEEFVKEEFQLFSEMNRLQIDESLREKSYCLNCNKFGKPALKAKYQLKKPYKYQIWICSNCGSTKLEHSNNHKTKRRIIEIIYHHFICYISHNSN
jgi:RNase P subunit RPR2